MADRIIIAYPKRPSSSLLTVLENGKEVGEIYLDAPGSWLIKKPSPPPPGYPTVEAAIKALLDSLNGG